MTDPSDDPEQRIADLENRVAALESQLLRTVRLLDRVTTEEGDDG